MLIGSSAHEDIKELYEHWLGLAPGGGLPGRQHFDPVLIPSLLPNIWLIDVHREPLRFWLRLAGSRIEEFAGKTIAGSWMAERLSGHELSRVTGALEQVVETKRPNWRRGKPRISWEKDYIEIERLYLPLASDGELVDMVLAMTVFAGSRLPRPSNANEAPIDLR